MIKITKNLDLNTSVLTSNLPEIQSHQVVLIDIETTGFSPKSSIIYLISCIYFIEHECKFIQWLCEHNSDEKEMLSQLSLFLNDFEYAIHYNGTTFDFPFIKGRLDYYSLDSNIDNIIQIDVYTRIKPFAKFLPLSNLKLKTLEKFFGFYRNDPYDGGTLIQAYHDFTLTKDDTLKEMLLLHNEEDLLGLHVCLNILKYVTFFTSLKNKTLSIQDFTFEIVETEFIIRVPIETKFTLNIDSYPVKLSVIFDQLVLSLPIIEDELKYYLKDYKDYYYLPLEDTVIHNSIARFVDSSHKVKATKENAYIKKRGKFIPLSKSSLQLKTFHYSIKDTLHYVELSESLTSNNDLLIDIVLELLSSL